MINPFENRFVNSPRNVGASVPGLNDHVLQALLDRVAELSHGPPPRSPQPPRSAIRVMSPEPGCGKSHLLGRFFSRLQSDATRLYIQPFGDESTAWTSILQQTIQEMTYPESSKAEYCQKGENDQLDAFANGVLAHLAAAFIRREYPDDNPWEDFLRQLVERPVEVMGLGHTDSQARRWFEERFDAVASFALSYFPQVGVNLQGGHRIKSWLRVLFLYATSASNADARELGLEWLKVKSIPDDATELGISKRDCESQDLTASQREEKCRFRIRDLCALAAFYRPFVFCFDQTETYGQRAALAKTFGRVVAQLVNDAANQLTVVTANAVVWKAQLEPAIEKADLDRMSDLVELSLLSKVQASWLVRLRIQAAGLDAALEKDFLDESWLDSIFQGGKVSVRRFLDAASKRFAANIAEESPPLLAKTLEALFVEERQSLLTSPRRLAFSPDILRWFLEKLPDRAIPSIHANGRFHVKWTLNGNREILFCLEEGAHHFRWRNIAQTAMDLRGANRAVKCVALRTSEQCVVPKAGWTAIGPIIEKAKKTSCLEIRIFTQEETADIHAAWALYSRACQQDIAKSGAEVLAFCRERLRALGKSLARAPKQDEPMDPPPVAKAPTDPQALVTDIERVVEAKRFIGYEQLASQLTVAVTLPLVIQACAFSAKINVLPHPQSAVFLWSP